MHDTNCSRRGTTRRDFLAVFAGIAGTPLMSRFSAHAEAPRLDLAPGQSVARVALARSRMTLDVPKVHRPLTRELIESSLMKLTETQSPKDAWHAVLKPEDIIGLKFNQSGQRMIGTSDAMAEVIVGSLVDAGWSASQIVCIEAPKSATARLGTLRATTGFDRAPKAFASGEDQFASLLHQVTALISIPFLKTHNICTLTCALKNLSHAMVKHPAQFHGTHCAPYISDIVNTPIIRDKLRLTIVDALRVVHAEGPVVTSHNMTDTGALIVATDLVAADAVGLALINDIRQNRNLPPIATSPEEVPYLVAAHTSRLGIAAPHGIDLLRISV